jgi:hypothetical protein
MFSKEDSIQIVTKYEINHVLIEAIKLNPIATKLCDNQIDDFVRVHMLTAPVNPILLTVP